MLNNVGNMTINITIVMEIEFKILPRSKMKMDAILYIYLDLEYH